MILENNKVCFINGQEVEILDKLNERGKIIIYSGIIKNVEKNILIIEMNLNYQDSNQIQLFVYDQENYQYFKEKFQFTYLKTQNDCLIQLNQHQICFWHQYFQQQEFKLLTIKQKELIFFKYCRKLVKQKTQDLCFYSQNNLGNIFLKGIDNRLFRNNDLIDQLDINIYEQLDNLIVYNFGNLYFEVLTDINSQQLNQMTQDQQIQFILDSPLYEEQKQKIITFLNPKYVEQLTKQQLINLLQGDHFDIKNNQQMTIIYQFQLQQQQIQNQLNNLYYLNYRLNKINNNEVLLQEYQNIKNLNSELHKFIQNNQYEQIIKNEIEEILKQQLEEVIKLTQQFYTNLKQKLLQHLILQLTKLQQKLDKLYKPTQFLGQFGTLKITLYQKLQHEIKTIIQSLQQQINLKFDCDIISILQFNQFINSMYQKRENIKIDFKAYQNQMVIELMQIKQLLQLNSNRIKKELQRINLKYLMIVSTQDESDQTSFITNILESQQFVKKIIYNQQYQIPEIIYKKNRKVDILMTTLQYQELECIIRDLNQLVEEQQQKILQIQEQYNLRISNFVNELRQKIQEQLDEVKYEFISQFEFLINLTTNQNIIDNQQIIENQNRRQQIVEKQMQRFCIIEELLQQNQTKKQYYNSIEKKIEEEKIYIQILVNQELKILNELLSLNNNNQGDLQEYKILDLEFMILKKQYYNVICLLEQEIQNIKQKFTNLDAAFQEQLLLSRKIEILCQENTELIHQFKNKNQIIKKITEKFEESKKRFNQFFQYFQSVKKDRIQLQQDQDRLCLEINKKINEIQDYFEIIQNQNIKKTMEEKRMEYQQFRSKLELIYKEILIKGNHLSFNSQAYYKQFTLVIFSKFYHMSRFHQRLLQSNAYNNNQYIYTEDLELIDQYKEEYKELETKVDYYRNVIIENPYQELQIENLQDKLEELQKQIEQKYNYLLSVIQFYIYQHTNQTITSKIIIDQLQKFANYLEFSKFLPYQLITSELRQNQFSDNN